MKLGWTAALVACSSLGLAVIGARPQVAKAGPEADDEPSFVTASPRVEVFPPPGSVIPSNTLRLYLSFSEPMARGQAMELIHLEDDEGRRKERVFLNLETELWDPSQKHLTIFFDPGRIKRGVGPNLRHGAPLNVGEEIILVISGRFESAGGRPLGSAVRTRFRVAEPQRGAVELSSWRVKAPHAGSRQPLKVLFDRWMDPRMTRRWLRVMVGESPLRGDIETDGRVWQFRPRSSWSDRSYHVRVQPTLEDIAGNTLLAPFDAVESHPRESSPAHVSFVPR